MKMGDDAIVAGNDQLRSRGFDSLPKGFTGRGWPIRKSAIWRMHFMDRMARGRDRLDGEARLAKRNG